MSSYAGNYCPADVEIQGSRHKPVDASQAQSFIEHMCDYVIAHWNGKPAVPLASYIMWRLDWLHRFTDGNGRTSKMVPYVVAVRETWLLLPIASFFPRKYFIG
ncbi:Fic family protein [Sinorhizobium terangae]|uniref:Fic family protein n=1 Tax=Sinorhizobium terangae TaxID=110322 RepID=UPI002E1937F2